LEVPETYRSADELPGRNSVADDKGATPPGGGRMDHDVMRRASELPVEGAAATDTLAASGGLEMPGRVRQGVTEEQAPDSAEAEREKPPTAASVEKMERLTRTEER
jgi:hypothetical protein